MCLDSSATPCSQAAANSANGCAHFLHAGFSFLSWSCLEMIGCSVIAIQNCMASIMNLALWLSVCFCPVLSLHIHPTAPTDLSPSLCLPLPLPKRPGRLHSALPAMQTTFFGRAERKCLCSLGRQSFWTTACADILFSQALYLLALFLFRLLFSSPGSFRLKTCT